MQLMQNRHKNKMDALLKYFARRPSHFKSIEYMVVKNEIQGPSKNYRTDVIDPACE